MRQADIQARIDAGLGLAAGKLGASYQVYRPTDPLQPLAAPLLSLQAVIGRDPDYRLRRPAGFGDAMRILMADASLLMVGDVLVGGEGTFFVASLAPNTPALLIDCNAVLGISVLVLSNGYAGGAEGPVAIGWPASLRLAGKSGPDPAALPGDPRGSAWQVLLPASLSVALRGGMRLIDAAGRRLLVAAAERSALGWRLAAQSAGE